jgi:predicted DCC family thiol-disulfide oxidoreductase YuxK
MRELLPACPLDPHQPSLLIYDGNCRLCVAAKEGLDRAGMGEAGSGVRMIPYESEEAVSALGERYRPGPPSMAYLVSPAGAVSQGVEAFLPLVSGLPGGRVIRWMLRWSYVRALTERAYGVIARHRYRLFGAVKPSVR